MLYCDRDKYGHRARSPLVEAFNGAVKDRVRGAFAKSGLNWADFVFGLAEAATDRDSMAEIEASLLALGYRFDWSAAVSRQERPDVYKPLEGEASDFMFRHSCAPAGEPRDGRQLCGVGDNVVRHLADISGIATYIRSPQQVLAYLTGGVPPETIALIDDSGGTLTAPIIQQFKGVICAGGSTRSHLGILTREYGVPCLMNAKVNGIRHGDRVEIEVSAPAKTAAAYQSGVEMTANIWRIVGE